MVEADLRRLARIARLRTQGQGSPRAELIFRSVSAFPTHLTSDGAFLMSLFGLAGDPQSFLVVA
jgi:hypothetical protein